MKKINFLGIDRVYENNRDKFLQIIDGIYSRGSVLMGSEVDEFEEKIANYCGRKYAASVGSCTDGLFFSLKAASIKEGDEVLVTSYSFVASVTPILRLGAIPVFVDIDTEYFMMDVKDLDKKISKKTKAILAVHLFGQALPMDKIESIANLYNLIIIEDAAQSLGTEYKNRRAGSFGLVSAISFDPTKIIGAFGNGGVVLTDNIEIYNVVKKMRYHGKNLSNGEFELLGYNSRMATSQAALLSFQLDILDAWINRRIEIANKYREELKQFVQLPKIRPDSNHVYHKFVIKVNERDKLKKYLDNKGVKSMIHYKKALFEHPLVRNNSYIEENINNVSFVSSKVLSLPIYPEMTNEEVEYVCNCIKKFYK